jgi:hypothetical protein
MREELEKHRGGVAEVMNANSQPARVLRHPKLPHLELGHLLAKTFSQEKPWHVVSRIDNTNFGRFDPGKATELVTDWPHGRVFSSAYEIRWQRASASGDNDVLLLTEDASVAVDGFSALDSDCTAAELGVALLAWGSPVQPDKPHIRAETRLPRKLHYPSGCEKGRLTCKYYLDGSGAVQFIRLVGVE